MKCECSNQGCTPCDRPERLRVCDKPALLQIISGSLIIEVCIPCADKYCQYDWEYHMILVESIRENPVALSPVDMDDPHYKEYVKKLKAGDTLTEIVVRSQKDMDYWEIVDGHLRYHAYKEAGKAWIPAKIVALDDDAVLVEQIKLNPFARPIDYSLQLRRIIMSRILITLNEIATLVEKNTKWVSTHLGLDALRIEAVELVEGDEIVLSNAYALAKLPSLNQIDFIDRARTMKPDEFVPAVTWRLKELAKKSITEPTEPRKIMRCLKHKWMIHASEKGVEWKFDSDPIIGGVVLGVLATIFTSIIWYHDDVSGYVPVILAFATVCIPYLTLRPFRGAIDKSCLKCGRLSLKYTQLTRARAGAKADYERDLSLLDKSG